MWISKRRRGLSANGDFFFKFHNIIIKCRNVDKGKRRGQAIWIFFFEFLKHFAKVRGYFLFVIN